MRERSALVTGAPRGIGRVIAADLAARGFGLTITSRSEDDLRALRPALVDAGAGHVELIAADLANRDLVEAVAAAHGACFGSMDALILNAGVGSAAPIDGYPQHRARKTFEVNFFAALSLVQASLPWLRRAAQRSKGSARVIALSSITGAHAERDLAVYGASKAALLSLMETLTLEEATNGVLGTAIAPGYVRTDMSAWVTDTIPADTMIPPEDVARVVGMILDLAPQTVVTRIVLSRAAADAYTA